MAQLTEHDVVNVRFNEPKRAEDGFDKDQVDFFLDEVAETIASLTKEKAELEAQLQTAQARITELENQLGMAVRQPDQAAPSEATSTAQFAQLGQGTDDAASATSMLSLAQRLHDEHVANGRAEEERIIADAHSERARIITEAEEIHNRTLTKLEEERSLLERKISELREFERDYRTRLRSYLESLLQNVETQNNQ
ncbi:DivIVA domain-containing protein [Trueperella pyogenes]|uniref:Cell wall synthesis protein Wag31 n=2 Tax=Trueperella pyogenes TaxID=1661 RepID=X4QMM8_9ACTO|nr:DivIVA domain-containing protein [Trueperella pyogenes]AHU88902.1 cell division protein DivIVA [Trueperella pyogenes]AWA42815.1 DivIVA domain-containing protein [Trueperella pyogenes]AWG04817.1 DivIVA domain-containing protein [Trueperella pyogenes]AWG15643.1 DivIVA domain-containing protein [Trueperella pyogenes]AZR00246.1 DivIVA domain-containing protein [Trueperella pyogenes]